MQKFLNVFSASFFILAFVLNCATPPATDHAPLDLSPEAWEKSIVGPPDLKSALSKAKIESIPNPGSADIVMRVFGKDGEKTPVIMSMACKAIPAGLFNRRPLWPVWDIRFTRWTAGDPGSARRPGAI